MQTGSRNYAGMDECMAQIQGKSLGVVFDRFVSIVSRCHGGISFLSQRQTGCQPDARKEEARHQTYATELTKTMPSKLSARGKIGTCACHQKLSSQISKTTTTTIGKRAFRLKVGRYSSLCRFSSSMSRALPSSTSRIRSRACARSWRGWGAFEGGAGGGLLNIPWAGLERKETWNDILGVRSMGIGPNLKLSQMISNYLKLSQIVLLLHLI